MGMPREKVLKLLCDACGDGEGFTAEGIGWTVADTVEEAERVVRDCEGEVVSRPGWFARVFLRQTPVIVCRGCIEEQEREERLAKEDER